jgi:hypothetical protein
MPRGVYARTATFGEGHRQRAQRRREIQENLAQEVERLELVTKRQRTAIKRAAVTIDAQRHLLNGLTAFRELLAGVADADHLWDRPAADASAHVLLASLCVGANADRIAVVTGLPRAVIVEREHRLRGNGVWRGPHLRQRWELEEHGDMRFALDVLVAEGALYRSWDGETYAVDPLPGPDLGDRDLRTAHETRGRRKGQHATLRLADVQPCFACSSEPAYRGVCAEHILTVHIDDLTQAWNCHARDVYKRRWRILGLCKTCRKGPLYSSGFCEEHYRKEKAGDLTRRRRKREWTISRDEVDQWAGTAPSGIDSASAEEHDARTLLFNRLLRDLLGSAAHWPPTGGRPRCRLDDLLFALVTVARTNLSTRGVQPVLVEAQAAGWLHQVPHHNALGHYLNAGERAPLIAPTVESLLGAVNAGLAELGIEPGYPVAPTSPLIPRAAASPIWVRLLGVAAQGRRGKAIDLAARHAGEPVGVERRLAQIVRALMVLVAEVRRRGIEGWLTVDGSGFSTSNEAAR